MVIQMSLEFQCIILSLYLDLLNNFFFLFFLFLCHAILKYIVVSHSVISDSLQSMDFSLLGSSVHGIFQARILE